MFGYVIVNNYIFFMVKFLSEGFVGVYYIFNNDNFEVGKIVDDYMFLSL